MKLQPLLTDLFNGPLFDKAEYGMDYVLMPEVLCASQYIFSQVDEFKDSDLSFYNPKEENLPLTDFKTYKVFDGMKLTGKVKLYSIMLGGPNGYLNTNSPTKESGIVNTWNPNDFTPQWMLYMRCINMLSIDVPSVESEIRQMTRESLHKKLDAMLDDPEKFMIPLPRCVMIRAMLENTTGLGYGREMMINMTRITL